MERVIIYGKDACPWCKMAENYMNNNSIKYDYIDVANDENALNLIIEKTGQRGVPIIKINNKYILGYDVKKIEEYLSEG